MRGGRVEYWFLWLRGGAALEALDDTHRVPLGSVAGECSLEGSEGLIGLGSYGEPLTVLTVAGLEERIGEREELQGSWAPRCGRR